MTFPYLYIFLLYSSPLPSHLPISPIHFSFLASSPSIFEPFYLDTVSSLLCVYEYSNNVMWKTAACNIYHLLRVLTLFFFSHFWYYLILGEIDIDATFMIEHSTIIYLQPFGRLWVSAVIMTYGKKKYLWSGLRVAKRYHPSSP